MKHRTTPLFIVLGFVMVICASFLLTTMPAAAKPPAPSRPPTLPPPSLNPQGRGCTIIRIESEGDETVAAAKSGTQGTVLQAFEFDQESSQEPEQVIKDDPSLVTDAEGNLYTVWVDMRNSNLNIYFARSLDGGRTWSDDIKVNDTPDQPALQAQATVSRRVRSADVYANPDITIDHHGHLYVTWVDNRNGNSDIYFARSRDQGSTWSSNVRINDDDGVDPQYDPTIAVATPPGDADADTAQTTVYIAWEDYRDEYANIYLARSDDGGNTWSGSFLVSKEWGSSENPQIITAEDGSVYCVWCHNAISQSAAATTPGDDPTTPAGTEGHDIYFAHSENMGMNWSDAVVVNDGMFGSAETPTIALDMFNNIYVAWHDTRSGNPDIYMSYSSDGGMSWEENIKVNDDSGEAYQLIPSITIDISGTIYIAWEDYRNNDADIYLTVSGDGGQNWVPNIRLNDDSGTAAQGYPSLAADEQNTVYATWKDQRDSSGDVYLSKSSDGGNEWEPGKSVNTRGGVNDDDFLLFLPSLNNNQYHSQLSVHTIR
jgi:hypothetical protein